jgi:PEP-CTERM motif
MRVRLITLLGSLLLLSSLASAQFNVKPRPRYNVPEPSMLAMAGVGVAGVAGAVWRKVRK